MITWPQIEKHLEWFHDAIDEIAEAKAKLDLLESQSKSVEADLMLRSGLTSNAAQKTWALAHQEYKDHLLEIYHYAGKYEAMKLKKDYVMATLDGWRTLESSRRALDRGVR